ncbi:MAG: YgiT-type zinc finger protein [Archaeoglobaceae archaeon]
MKCQKCGSEMIEKEDYVYVIPDINLAVANLKAYVCPECDYVELPAESVDAIEKAEEEWRRQLKEREKAKAEI